MGIGDCAKCDLEERVRGNIRPEIRDRLEETGWPRLAVMYWSDLGETIFPRTDNDMIVLDMLIWFGGVLLYDDLVC